MGHCKRYRATGPELTAWLLPPKGTVGRDVSAVCMYCIRLTIAVQIYNKYT